LQYITYQNTTPIIKRKSLHQLETNKDEPFKVFDVLVTHPLACASTSKSAVLSTGLFLVNYHLDRLVESAQSLGIWNEQCPTHNRDLIENELAQQIVEFAGGGLVNNAKVIVYVIIGSDGLELMLDWFDWPRPPFAPISLVSVRAQRAIPLHKTTLMEASVDARKKAHQRHAQEAIMLDEQGLAHDCAWSNYFWVDREGTLYTSNHNQVLPGVTRRIILELVPTVFRNATLTELTSDASEIFITQSTMGISPVSSINGISIGDECPGTTTMKIGALYNQWINSMCTPLDHYKNE
jgi:branched-subunit amino acid aminotransferase/4-amino-4-deoxychorismate lyase